MNADQVRKAIDAKRSLVAAAQVLWNVRLELLVSLGHGADAILAHMEASVEEGCNNCDCNTCGPPGSGCYVRDLSAAGDAVERGGP